ncbi:MAG: ChaN family lipoprotein [Hydrogenobacter thermophilus]|uniref:ChaN family lipoprotein n=1 Tax=Hydrogenobacter thermophilus TaxID=940 RepID=UPI001C75F11B|nr:ChaN family lipoprotein [Hydrogenobacter thermophilus]QWK19037.1 MAG: ChaN family lipoprotein [Hydrogenobacter thermophilus]
MFFKILVLLLMTYLMAFTGSLEDSIKSADVIYIPEEHTNREDHVFQLKVIKYMQNKDYKFVIGMEMFQQNFQKYLDEYINCKLSEEDMLEKTQYRKRWGFDPSLYSPIWRFAKEKGIRLYALNVPSELLTEIRQVGLDNVESPLLPKPIIDQTPQEKEYLLSILRSHPKADEKSFFEVQNAWDNVMAYAIIRILKENPGIKVVALVGKGHAHNLKAGIPYRVEKLDPQVRQVILTKDHFLFSMDFSKESSSANSMRVPNCSP